jgi:hypothetical protein
MAVIDWSNWPNRMAKQRSQPLTDIVRPRDPAKFHRKVLKASHMQNRVEGRDGISRDGGTIPIVERLSCSLLHTNLIRRSSLELSD